MAIKVGSHIKEVLKHKGSKTQTISKKFKVPSSDKSYNIQLHLKCGLFDMIDIRFKLQGVDIYETIF